MDNFDVLLRELADTPDDYQRDGALAFLIRHGEEIALDLREVPGAGLSVLTTASTNGTYVPLASYIQRDILKLPVLAKQILRVLERTSDRRPAPFVEGPAEEVTGAKKDIWQNASLSFSERLVTPEPGATKVWQLMARAGQGKTVLLEHVAMGFAKAYQPEPYPQPILLPVDLLGRYVGTVDDAIAGTLNNTYSSPGLSQRDVALCIQQRWIVLALDGFDELVARVGIRDAFLRITELLDQLGGKGSIVLSARESFFDLYEVTAGIRTYLEPKSGSYSTTAVRLLQWTEKQGREVFIALGSTAADADLTGLLDTFEGDREIVFHPFFLTRLAALWQKGERFVQVGQQPDAMGRIKYVIETFVQRETEEKWKSRDGSPLLAMSAHTEMLATVAEEMWRSGAFRLDVAELRLAAELGLAPLQLPDEVVASSIERVPTHAALALKDQRYSFLHDKFLQFFLGFRLAVLLRQESKQVTGILEARDLGPEVMDWVTWNWQKAGGDSQRVIAFLNDLRSQATEGLVSSNLAYLAARLLDKRKADGILSLTGHTFVGDSFSQGEYERIEFRECRFWHLDLSGSRFTNCAFRDCRIGDVKTDGITSFAGSTFINSVPTSLEIDETKTVFAPADVMSMLSRRGAKSSDVVAPIDAPEPEPSVQPEVSRCVARFVRQSERTCDVAVEEIERGADGDAAAYIAKVGVREGVLKNIERNASGQAKTFVRFTVDRQKLIRGQAGVTKDRNIDAFWSALSKRYPYRP